MNMHLPTWTRTLVLNALVLLLTTSTVAAQEKLKGEETILTPVLAGTPVKKSEVGIDPGQVVLAQPGQETEDDSPRTNDAHPLQTPAGKTAAWDTQIDLSTLSGDQTAPNMVTDANDHLYVALETTDSANPHRWIRVYKSTDAGESWSYWGGFFNATEALSLPTITYGNGFVLVSYTRAVGHTLGVARRPTDASAGWSFFSPPTPTITATEYVARARFASDAEVFAGNAWFYLAYLFAQPGGDYELYFTRSTDNGVTWSAQVLLGTVANSYINGEVGIDWGNSGLYVAYLGTGVDLNKVLLRKSIDFGASFGSETVIYDNAANKLGPSVAVHNDNVLVGFQYELSATDDDVRALRSINAGTAWTLFAISEETSNERFPWVAHDNVDNFYATYDMDGDVYAQIGAGTPAVDSPVQINTSPSTSDNDFTTVTGFTGTSASEGGAAAWVAGTAGSFNVYGNKNATSPGALVVLTPTSTGSRPPLVTTGPSPGGADRVIPPHESKTDIFQRMGRDAPSGPGDAAVQSASGTLGAPTILTGFEGLDINGFLPPDSDGGIGISHYFEWINVELAIFDRTGTIVFGPAAGSTMFAGMGAPCETLDDGDPVVLFDQLVDRWFVSQFAVTGGANSLCIAISSGSDPTTSSWFLYEYNFGGVFPDYEKYGIWDDMYTLTFHGFVGPFNGLRVGAFDRTAMLASDPTAQLQFFNANVTLAGDFFGGLPPRVQGPANVDAGTPAPFIHMASNEGFGGTDRYTLLELDVDFITPANTTLTQTDLAADPYDQDLCSFARDCIPQPGTAVGLDSFGGNTLFQAPVRDLDPTAGLDLRLLAQAPVDADGADLAGIRWIELQNTGGGWSVRQQSTFAPADGRHRWMGSIAMNGAGDIAMGYSVSDGTSTFPAIWATGRLAGDPLNTMAQGETVLRAGVSSQTHPSNRWGDYSVTNVDPTDDHSFWHVNEYVTAAGTWSTHIAHFELSAGSVTRYVAMTGSDAANDCTIQASPCATIAHAVSEANPGDTLDIEAGTYAAPGLITKELNIVAAGVVVE